MEILKQDFWCFASSINNNNSINYNHILIPCNEGSILSKVRVRGGSQHSPEVPWRCHGDQCLYAGEGHWAIVGGLATGCVHLIQTEAVEG